MTGDHPHNVHQKKSMHVNDSHTSHLHAHKDSSGHFAHQRQIFKDEQVCTSYLVMVLLSLQAGILNVGGFLACHRFVTHVTGFATHFAAEVISGEFISAIGMVSVPAFFIVGSMMSALATDRRVLHGKHPKYTALFFLISLIMLTIIILGDTNVFGKFGDPLDIARDYTLLSLLVLASGIQNAIVTTASGAVIRTTHLTGISTDLGIGLVRIWAQMGRPDQLAKELRANWIRASIIGGFVFGGLFGALVFSKWSYNGFIAPLTISGGIFLYLVNLHRKQRNLSKQK